MDDGFNQLGYHALNVPRHSGLRLRKGGDMKTTIVLAGGERLAANRLSPFLISKNYEVIGSLARMRNGSARASVPPHWDVLKPVIGFVR